MCPDSIPFQIHFLESIVSTRGLLSFRFKGQDYVTYNHCDSYPEALGAWVCRFAQEHLDSEAAIEQFGLKIQALEWVDDSRDWRTTRLQGKELLEAIVKGEVRRVSRNNRAFRLCLDCEFAYVLDLDAGVMQFWDLVEGERLEEFSLVSLTTCAVAVMECARCH
jgi:hypothetical protein